MFTARVKGSPKMLKKFFQGIADGAKTELRVGIMDTATTVDGVNVAQYAYWNEYGTKHIPARPFMRQTFEKHKAEWVRSIRSEIKRLGATPEGIIGAFHNVGILAERQMGQVVESTGSFKANAPSTVKAKGKIRNAKGEIVGTREAPPPLTDTGTMKEAITYEVTP